MNVDMGFDIEAYRCERKYKLSGLTVQEVESLLKLHPAMFSEIYRQRWINNIYFDSLDMKHYNDNVAGVASRKKVRIRWYGECFGEVAAPVMEIKHKEGVLGRKESFALSGFRLSPGYSRSVTAAAVAVTDALPGRVKGEFKSLFPFLLNRYSRRYFRSADGHFRVTIDTHMNFYATRHPGNLFMARTEDQGQVVVELKYNAVKDERADAVSACFPFRLSRSSKYVTGIDMLYL